MSSKYCGNLSSSEDPYIYQPPPGGYRTAVAIGLRAGVQIGVKKKAAEAAENSWPGDTSSPVEKGGSANSGRHKLVRLLAFVLVPALFVGIVGYGLFSTAPPSDLIGTQAPEFELPLLGSDEKLSSQQLRGRPVVVNFWASWCVPCREEAPILEGTWQKYKDAGVEFLGVNVQDTQADAQAFVDEFGITFPSVRDTDLELWTKMGVRGVPETFFIDHEWTFVGIGSGEELASTGGTKILGAIDRAVLESQIQIMLDRQAAASSN